MKLSVIGLFMSFLFALVSSGNEFKTLLSDVEFDLLNGKNIALFICKADQITSKIPLSSVGMNGYISFGQSGRALIKQKIQSKQILYMSPVTIFGMSNGDVNKVLKNEISEISEVWIEVENFGADLAFISPFENLESCLVVAESVQIGDKFILLVKQIRPESDSQRLFQAIAMRKKNDYALIVDAKKIIELRSKSSE